MEGREEGLRRRARPWNTLEAKGRRVIRREDGVMSFGSSNQDTLDLCRAVVVPWSGVLGIEVRQPKETGLPGGMAAERKPGGSGWERLGGQEAFCSLVLRWGILRWGSRVGLGRSVGRKSLVGREGQCRMLLFWGGGLGVALESLLLEGSGGGVQSGG